MVFITYTTATRDLPDIYAHTIGLCHMYQANPTWPYYYHYCIHTGNCICLDYIIEPLHYVIYVPAVPFDRSGVYVTGSAKTELNSAIQIFQYKALKYIG